MRFVLALALTGAVAVAGTAALARGTASRGVPAGFSPETAAAVGAHDYWVFGSYRCAAGRCLALVRSTDAGKHFIRIGAPPLASQGTVSTIRFANPQDGYAWTWRAGLYATHDGGASWHRAGPKGGVAALAIGAGQVYAVFGRSRFERASVSGDRWHVLPSLVRKGLPVSLAARGRDVWLLGVPRHHHPDDTDELVRSTDGGKTFAASRGPCFSELGGGLAPTSDRVVWAVCPTGNFSQTHRSTNDGRSFRVVRTPGQTNGADVVPFSGTGAVLERGVNGPLYRTVDAGGNWTAVRGMGKADDVLWVAFTTRRLGAALVQSASRPAKLLRTTNGGATWLSTPIR